MPSRRPDAIKINPAGIYPFVDVVQVWLKQPLHGSELRHVKSLCVGGIQARYGLSRFDPSYSMRLRMLQPSDQALGWAANRDDVHLNYVEISLDWTFDTAAERDEAYQFACQHHVKKYHRDQGVRFQSSEKGITRYTGPRTAPNNLVAYNGKHSKVSGEVYCVHFDWRMKGSRTLQSAGIESVGDLIELNHNEFWKYRLLFYAIDADNLGRLTLNEQMDTDRRQPLIIKKKIGDRVFAYYVDRRTGWQIIDSHGSTQAVIDAVGRKIRVSRCIRKLDVDHLLPEDPTA